MDPDERDVEIFERIPWESLEKPQDRRWVVYLLAAGLVMGAVGVTVGRGMTPSSAPEPTAPVSVSAPPVTEAVSPTPTSSVPVAAALYSAAEFGHLRAALVISVLLVVTSTYFRYVDGETIAFLLGYELVSTVTLMAAAIALGDRTRSRRALRAEQEEIARLIRQEHAHRAEQRVQAERMRMARELHDVIGHSISVISLHTDVAREAVGRDDEATRQALGHVRVAASEAMQELRATVKVLRQPADKEGEQASLPASSQPLGSLRALGTLVAHARNSGLTVDVEVTGAVDGLPGTVDTAAFRIIQESLTNVLRHAQATRVAVVVQVEPRAVQLRVTDNGREKAEEIGVGSGIAGMRERARLLGGRLTAEALATGGFEVRATLPLEDGS